MNVTSKSLHARLYKFTYNSNLPPNLCPYFWKLVWGIIILIPNFIIQLPILIYHLFKDKEYYKYKTANDNRVNGIGSWFGLFLSIMFLFGNYHLIKALFNAYSYIYEAANVAVFADLILLNIVIAVVYTNWRDRNPREEKPPGVIEEFIKAKYNNYCPKLEWDKKEEKSNNN